MRNHPTTRDYVKEYKSMERLLASGEYPICEHILRAQMEWLGRKRVVQQAIQK